MSITLRGLTWNDPRGRDPLLAASKAFAQTNPGRGIDVQWGVQPLEGFESRPLSELARRYDLLVIDHPHTGEAAESGLLAPIDHLPDEFVGRCAESYYWRGAYWAIPIDAACQVSAWREGVFSEAPENWAAVFDAPRSVRIAAPLKGVHALMALGSVLASLGESFDPDSGEPPSAAALAEAAHLLRKLAILAPDSLNWNPIEALNALVDRRIDYIPLTFGYSRYEDAGVRFGAIPGIGARDVASPILGGTGLAISANCAHRDAALEFARFAASRDIQACIWPRHSGQPAHRDAWDLMSRTKPFYRDTRSAIETAFVRPRCLGWTTLQTAYGLLIEAWLAGDSSAAALQSELRGAWTERSPKRICSLTGSAMDSQG